MATRKAEETTRKCAVTAYVAAVACLTTALEKGLRSGELRGWEDGDAELEKPPLFVLETECERRFVRTRERAALVLMASRSVDDASTRRGRWGDDYVLPLALRAVALDVLACAEDRGWTPRARKAA